MAQTHVQLIFRDVENVPPLVAVKSNGAAAGMTNTAFPKEARSAPEGIQPRSRGFVGVTFGSRPRG